MKNLDKASKQDIDTKREKFMAITFTLRSADNRFKKLNEDLKGAANKGRDEYCVSLTEDFNLLVRESGEYDTVKNYFYSPRHGCRGRGGGRGRHSFLFSQGGRGEGGRGESE